LWTLSGAGLSFAADASPGESAEQSDSAATPANSLLIPAFAYDRGNPRTYRPGEKYADAGPMVTWGGQYPVVVEYDIDFPVTAQYTLHIFYAAATARPAELFLDGKPQGTCCRVATGSWNTSGAKWEETCKLSIAKGRHTVELSRSAPFPHVVSLRFDSPVPFPPDWKPHRPGARKLSDGLVGGAQDASVAAIRRAITDLMQTSEVRYPRGLEFLKRLDGLEQRLEAAAIRPTEAVQEIKDDLRALQREALLANPLLDFDRLLLVKRAANSPKLGLPQNWQSNSSLPKTGFRDSVVVLSPVDADGQLTTLYGPEDGRFVGDLDLDFNGERLLFSMPGAGGRWQVFEIGVDGAGLRQLTGEQPDVDCYDACYLPDGKIIFTSSAYFNAVACTGDHAAVLYVMDADGQNIRQLTFDQEHDWCPTVLNNGRILYTRWEYTDTVHCHSRLLFHMNPDGTQQMEYLGGNSYWPNAFFYARPIPDHPTKVVAVISGHHGVPRMGELVVFDPARGRHEAAGAVQRIPGYGKKVEVVLKDRLVDDSWPKFLHPYPLSEKHFLVASKPRPDSLWGIYLVDTFDNMLLIRQEPGCALLEPIPLKRTPTPSVIPDSVDLARNDAVVYIADIYVGRGLKGIPRGTVKSLRVFTYHFAYQGMVGNPNTIGVDGPWDIKRVLGTVPVYEDGSAKFRIPANTPISIQPLDSEGKALQLMRSWMTAMPGETVQCAGCHEPQNSAPPAQTSLAVNRPPDEIKPWYGQPRGFSYRREVQPVIDRHCIACHDGTKKGSGVVFAKHPSGLSGKRLPTPFSLRGDENVTDYATELSWQRNADAGRFSVGYTELHRFVRRPGCESDYHVLEPMEFHADTTELVQILTKGHYGVRMDAEAWDRLITWIDLNCPFHGTRHEELVDPGRQRQRRRELLKQYANVDDDPEVVPGPGTGLYNSGEPIDPIVPKPRVTPVAQRIDCPDWPFGTEEAAQRQRLAGAAAQCSIDLGEGQQIDMVLIPAGEYLMGSSTGALDELPVGRVKLNRPFWMSVCEITNRQYNLFDPGHDSRVESKNATQYGIQGYPANRPEQPVVRVSWNETTAFCRWLSRQAGRPCSLPTEAQWEWACRAGSAEPLFFGDLDSDFSAFANVADAKLSEFASDVWDNSKPLKNATRYDEWFPKDVRFNDGALLSVGPGRYRPNPWGLCDMHGNVAEWTRTTYRPYPYDSGDGRDDPTGGGKKVVRGGSWFDRPKRSTSSFRLSYPPYQRVFNVGFRVICEVLPGPRREVSRVRRPSLVQ